MLTVDFGRKGQDHALSQLAHSCPEGRVLRSEIEIQVMC
jgi:hypothetical protein